MGWEFTTALVQVFLDPYITMGNAYQWTAFPQCFLPKWWLSWGIQNSAWLKNLMRRRIHICSDSRAALVVLAKTTTESSFVWECIQMLIKLSSTTSPLPSRANELLAVNKLSLGAAVGLLTGHTSLRTHRHKLGHTEWQECRLCGCDKEDSVHFVCDCPVLARKRYRIWGSIFLKPEDLKKVKVSSLLCLVVNTGLGLVS
jgi:hypothetical protein